MVGPRENSQLEFHRPQAWRVKVLQQPVARSVELQALAALVDVRIAVGIGYYLVWNC